MKGTAPDLRPDPAGGINHPAYALDNGVVLVSTCWAAPRLPRGHAVCFCPLQASVHGQYLVLIDLLTLVLYLEKNEQEQIDKEVSQIAGLKNVWLGPV